MGGFFLEIEGSVGSDVVVKKSLCGYARCRNAEKQNQQQESKGREKKAFVMKEFSSRLEALASILEIRDTRLLMKCREGS